jgi:predicted ester cyclase
MIFPNTRCVLTLGGMLLFSVSASAAQVDDAHAIALAKPQELIVSGNVTSGRREALLKPIDAFYGFWNNGSEILLKEALSPGFADHTLPPGRPQGPTGPAAAAKAFLAAVPDLKVTVVQRLMVADRVVSHLRFTGHFTGTFHDAKGSGQPIDFIATDILRVQAGKITDNWHLEDNLTFLKQIGLVPNS